MDARRRPAAAKAGLQQGRNEAERLRKRWEQLTHPSQL